MFADPLVAPALPPLLLLGPPFLLSTPRLLPPFSHPMSPCSPHLLVLACSYPTASAPRRGSPPLCRPQDLHTVGSYCRPSSPDPLPPSWQVWRWIGRASTISLRGAPLGAYPVQQGDIPPEHSKRPRGGEDLAIQSARSAMMTMKSSDAHLKKRSHFLSSIASSPSAPAAP